MADLQGQSTARSLRLRRWISPCSSLTQPHSMKMHWHIPSMPSCTAERGMVILCNNIESRQYEDPEGTKVVRG